MCRWLAYSGPPIYLEDLVVEPSRSLLVQSWQAQENYVEDMEGLPDGPFPTNGDGFGLGWYGDRPEPGIYRDLRPAWSDRNLLNLSAHIQSGLFFAHVRASYHGLVQRTNAHPFSHERWMFQHNGEIPGFSEIKRDMELQIKPELYPLIEGTTDTESSFYLALSLGLDENPKRAMEAMIGEVEVLREKAGIESPLRFTCAASDGEAIYALRYSTLYVNHGYRGAEELLDEVDRQQPLQIVLSEPLDDCSDRWDPVPESSFLTVRGGCIDVEDFSPSA